MTEFRDIQDTLRPRDTQFSAERVLEIGAEFIDHFNIEADPKLQPEEYQSALKQLDPRYQGDRHLVRLELEQDQTRWQQETVDVIMRAASGMRMLEEQTPAIETPDAIIILGGARQSNVDRLLYPVDEGLPRGWVKKPAVVMAGSERKLRDAEKQNVQNYAPNAETEFDLCIAAVEKYGSRYQGGVEVVRVYGDKAGTPEVIHAGIDKLILSGILKANRGHFDSGSLAAVTTQIYQVSTQLDLERVAARDGITNVFTMGNPSDPAVVASRTPATYLSEVTRTLKAASNNVAEKHIVEQQRKSRIVLGQKVDAQNEDPKNRETIVEYPDGSKIMEKPDGSQIKVEADGSEWLLYNPLTGEQFDGPDDISRFI